MSIMGLVNDTLKFFATMREWLGEGGKPAPNAQDRADVCSGRLSGKPCPHNYLGAWITPQVVANTVRRFVGAKNNLKLRVLGEEMTGHCECCNCVISLKVHVPITTILNHTPRDEFEKFPEWCWIKTEAKTTHEK